MTPTPDLSIEVDDVDICFERMKNAGFLIGYGPIEEPWAFDVFLSRPIWQANKHSCPYIIVIGNQCKDNFK